MRGVGNVHDSVFNFVISRVYEELGRGFDEISSCYWDWDFGGS